MSPNESQPQAREVYDRGYYHGQGSGYSRAGYREAHPDWSAWLDFLASLFERKELLVDLGCAYGYLPHEARLRGFRAIGLDASDFGPRQEPDFAPFLVQADVRATPLPSGCAQVVCLMDVLEHLPDPEAALAEAVRLLADDGVILGATPDPLHFEGREPTHCFERPPSFWLEALRSLGLTAAYRFSVEAYNFQFLAGHPGAAADRRLDRFGHDYFTAENDIVEVEGRASTVPRFGWSARHNGKRSILDVEAGLYLLNPGPGPLRVSMDFEARLSGWSALRVRWNSQVVGDFFPGGEPVQGDFATSEFVVPAGGHSIVFEVAPRGRKADIGRVRVAVASAEEGDLVERLPFDLYQRYRAAAELMAVLRPADLLDSGGVIGDEGGHLALPRDFLAAAGAGDVEVRSSDIRHCDHPSHAPLEAGRTPFAERRFEVVLSLDVLEHLPADDRKAYLEDLDRRADRWIVLGGPLQSKDVERAERKLRSGVMSMRRFLAEHERFGLPSASLIEDFFGAKGYQVLRFPNGWLPRWTRLQVWTQHYFSFDDYEISARFNRWCNRSFYRPDLRSPAYRTLFLICKTPLDGPVLAELKRVMAPFEEDASADGDSAAEEDFFALHERAALLLERRREAARDARYLVGEREKHIDLLTETADILRERCEAPLHRIAWRRLRGRE